MIALGQQILAVRPEHISALATTAFAQQRSGQFDQALDCYQNIVPLAASRTGPGRLGCATFSFAAVRNASRAMPEPRRNRRTRGQTRTARSRRAARPISWSSFAGEFLKEHSQELLLCLAVLLIVVSSTVGAHLLLGDLLWSPVGKCTLAMVATLLFAAFGAGLLRWGADRAGRMMLVATLIVVPIHFMLVGEMKLLHQPSALRLAFLVIEGDRARRDGALGERHACVSLPRTVSDRRASAAFRRQRGDRAELADGVGAAICLVSTVAPGIPGRRLGTGRIGGGATRARNIANSST